jgi:hypothetical protein
MDAHDPIVEQPAEQGRRPFGGVAHQLDHGAAGAPEHRIAGLDLAIHLDDGGPERIARPRHRADQPGLGQLLEIPIGGGGGHAELFGRRIDGPLGLRGGKERQHGKQAVAAAVGGPL